MVGRIIKIFILDAVGILTMKIMAISWDLTSRCTVK